MEDLTSLVTFQYLLCHIGQCGLDGRLNLPRRLLLGEVRAWVEVAAFSPGMGNSGGRWHTSKCSTLFPLPPYCGEWKHSLKEIILS